MLIHGQILYSLLYQLVPNVYPTKLFSLLSDRLVIMGNHRDAWVYGAGDPSSGTACMMEMSRVLGEMEREVPGMFVSLEMLLWPFI